MRHDYCPFCDLWNQYTEQCAYERCPLDNDPQGDSPAHNKARDAVYMYSFLVVDKPDPEEEAAHKRYLREQDGGDHYPDDSYY